MTQSRTISLDVAQALIIRAALLAFAAQDSELAVEGVGAADILGDDIRDEELALAECLDDIADPTNADVIIGLNV